MELSDLTSCWKETQELTTDFRQLEKLNRQYQKELESLAELQQGYKKHLAHQRYRMSLIKKCLAKLDKDKDSNSNKSGVAALKKEIKIRSEQLSEMEQTLPRPNGLYLSIILGSVNVSILNTNDKFKYKDEYEKFKLVLSIICLLVSSINIFITLRVMELALMFLLVWFYSTLTIRESILKVNGSRIKGWWRTHHFISAIAAAVLLIWPTTKAWYEFRMQFMLFCAYISVVQSLQFWYQRGVLYRLKALGERHDMDITIEGFHSWMWRGLSFLVPFLYFGYVFQAYNCYSLIKLSFLPEATWQIPALAFLFAVLFAGNLVTTSFVITQKIRSDYLQNLYLVPWVTRSSSSEQLLDASKDQELRNDPVPNVSDEVTELQHNETFTEIVKKTN